MGLRQFPKPPLIYIIFPKIDLCEKLTAGKTMSRVLLPFFSHPFLSNFAPPPQKKPDIPLTHSVSSHGAWPHNVKASWVLKRQRKCWGLLLESTQPKRAVVPGVCPLAIEFALESTGSSPGERGIIGPRRRRFQAWEIIISGSSLT